MNLFESHHEACMNCTSFVEIEGVVVDVNHFKYERTYFCPVHNYVLVVVSGK